MRPSDRHQPWSPASDRLMAEVARQLADAAPPAPEWQELVRAAGSAPSAQRPVRAAPWQPLAFAVVVATVVVGLWWLASPADAPQQPADLPAPATLETIEPVLTRSAWLAEAPPPEVQDCFAGVIGRLTIEQDAQRFVGREDLPGYDPARASLAALGPTVSMWAGVAADPRTSALRAAQLADVIGAHAEASSGSFGDEPETTQPGFGDDVDEARRTFAALAARRDPANCWWDTVDADRTVSASVRDLGSERTADCLVATAFDRLLTVLASQPDADADDVALVDAVHAAVFSQFESAAPSGLAELGSEITRLRTDPDADPSDVALAAQGELDRVIGEGGACPSELVRAP